MTESEQYVALIEQCRDRCLWFMAPGVIPSGRDEQVMTLDCVERYGSSDEFVKAEATEAMALTELQRSICRLPASTRFERGSYVAGGTALNEVLEAARRSRDVGLFHNTAEAVAATLGAHA